MLHFGRHWQPEEAPISLAITSKATRNWIGGECNSVDCISQRWSVAGLTHNDFRRTASQHNGDFIAKPPSIDNATIGGTRAASANAIGRAKDIDPLFVQSRHHRPAPDSLIILITKSSNRITDGD